MIRVLLFLTAGLAAGAAVAVDAPAQSVGSLDAAAIDHLKNDGPLYAPASTERFYRERDYARAWTPELLEELRRAIQGSADHGLTPRFYHWQDLQPGQGNVERLDILATDAYLALAGHLLGGMLNPVSMEPTWTARGREKDLVVHLRETLEGSGSIIASLETLAPNQPRYHLLQDALAHYREAARGGGWQRIDSGSLLKPGARDPRVPQIRSRLAATEDVPSEAQPAPGEETLYDETLVSAVRVFQRRANLEPDGVVGPATTRKLNRSAQDRIDQIRVNLERWRWLPEDLGPRHLRVNIADYRLEAHDDGEVSEIHDVMVGRPFRQTPVFSAVMTYLVLNPWWETPSKLARQDLLPKFQKDPGVVEALGYQVLDGSGTVVSPQTIDWSRYSADSFPFRIRQRPGPKNALGQVKFMFPNPHAVYLHDTPSRDLFAKTRRDFSSGCIRVKEPIDLVEWVLAGSGDWPRSRVESVIASGTETSVQLARKMPVHLLYWTVVADDETGGVRFLEDIYERDARVLEGLNLPPARR